MNWNLKSLVAFLFIGICTSYVQAKIPSELLYRQTDNVALENPTIQGFKQATKIYVNAQIYITEIDDKATLDQDNSRDCEKIYTLVPGWHTIYFISNAHSLFASGHFSFYALKGQHYQIKTDQADKKIGEEVSFWLENVDTGEKILPQ